MDSGEIIVSFSLGKNVLLEIAEKRFSDIEMDDRIDAIRISASLHKPQSYYTIMGKEWF